MVCRLAVRSCCCQLLVGLQSASLKNHDLFFDSVGWPNGLFRADPRKFCGAIVCQCSNYRLGAFSTTDSFEVQKRTINVNSPSHNHRDKHKMSRCQAVARPLARQLRQPCAVRPFTTGAPRAAEVQDQAAAKEPSALDLNPDTVLPEFEAQLIKAGKMPIGSRRRRVAMRTTQDIPFEQLPYQAFQEARKILAADREDKLAKIRSELEKITALEKKDAADVKGGQKMKDTKLASLRREVERLKLLADSNDPLVKKRFEDGLGKFVHILSTSFSSFILHTTNTDYV